AGSSFTGGLFSGAFVGTGSGITDVWHTGGNFGTTPGVSFLGTTDNQPLIIKVNGQQAVRFEPAPTSPNVIGGYAGNSAGGAQADGVTISGGGQNGLPNTVLGTNATYSTIAGGAANTISGTNVYHATISGGAYNTISGPAAYRSVIAGGDFNVVAGTNAFESA